MKFRRVILILLALALSCSLPVMGVTTYLDGKPQMSAALSGVNEFTAGQDATINVIVQNSGVNDMTFVMTGTLEREDVPTTAKMVRVGLSPQGAPVVVKSDPQNVGDIATQGRVTVPILVKILSNATAGEYHLPLSIRYTYLKSSDQPAADILQSNYVEVTDIIPITIKIKPQVKIDVLSAVPENLNVGGSGYLDLTIKNIGLEDGRKATVKISRNGASPIIPTDSSIFVGDFPHDGTVSCRYRVSVSGDAANQSYPVDVTVTYEDKYGDVVTSSTETVGIPVGSKLAFVIVSGPATVSPSSDSVIQVTYKNTGDATAYSAQARISAVDPFSSTDDTSYLGDLKPGETATASYQLGVSDTGAIKSYTLDTVVRYRDALDNSQVSDTFKVPVNVVPEPDTGIVRYLPIIGVIALIGAGAGYYLLKNRKKK